MLETFIQQVNQDLANNDLENAISRLQNLFTLADSELLSDIILLSARFKKLRSDVRKGILSYDEETISNNRIIDGLFSLLTEVKSQPQQFNGYLAVTDDVGKAEQKQRVTMSDTQKDVLMDRMARVKELRIPFQLLWIDDHPEWSQSEIHLVQSLGVTVTIVESSQDARNALEAGKHDLVVSDINREGNSKAGVDFLSQIAGSLLYRPFIFYVGQLNQQRGTPPFAFGITNWPNELLHLIMDVMERKG